jgi:dual specificity tyrosine-phosphorylation-regulated kinase 2/3/4
LGAGQTVKQQPQHFYQAPSAFQNGIPPTKPTAGNPLDTAQNRQHPERVFLGSAKPREPQTARGRVASAKPRESSGALSARTVPMAEGSVAPPPIPSNIGSAFLRELGPPMGGVPGSLQHIRQDEAQQSGSAGVASVSEPGKGVAITPMVALAHFESQLSRHERKEVLQFQNVFFLGLRAGKIDAPVANAANFGYDDERGDYVVVKNDHIGYRYEVQGELGKGSFGQVLKVFDHKTNDIVALKIIRNKKRFHQQAQVEIRILEHLKARDVEERSCTVVLLDHFEFRSHRMLVFPLHSMNLYELAKLNKYQPFAPALIKRFSAQLLVTLSFLWRERIIHCDLKPENILLRTENKTAIRVIDFGSSCFEHERIYTYIQSRFYRAPEIMFGLSYTRAIDLWSFGCIVCEMALGYPIFPGENEQDQLLCIMEVLGVPPPKLVERSPRKKQFFETTGQPKIVPNSRNKIRKPGTKDLKEVLKTDDDSFIDFLLLFLRWDPADRVTPLDAMQHPYISECFHQPPPSAATTQPSQSGRGDSSEQPHPPSSRDRLASANVRRLPSAGPRSLPVITGGTGGGGVAQQSSSGTGGGSGAGISGLTGTSLSSGYRKASAGPFRSGGAN